MIEVLKQIQQCLKDKMYAHAEMYLSEAIKNLENQEPVAWLLTGNAPLFDGEIIVHMSKPKWIPEWWRAEPLYTHPLQRTWVGLAKEDRLCAKYMQDAPEGIEAVIDYIETKLKENNT